MAFIPLISISESRPVGNQSCLLQRESTDNEPTNPIYEIRSNYFLKINLTNQYIYVNIIITQLNNILNTLKISNE